MTVYRFNSATHALGHKVAYAFLGGAGVNFGVGEHRIAIIYIVIGAVLSALCAPTILDPQGGRQ